MLRALFALVLAFAAVTAHAQQKMFFAEYHVVAAQLPANSPELQHRKLWLVGSKYMRFEDVPNAQTGVHGLIIVAEPDVWFIDRKTNRGQHTVDPGPSYAVHFPMFPLETSDRIKQLEFGREQEFFETSGATEKAKQTVDGTLCRVFSTVVDEREVVLYVRGDGKPFQVSISGGGGAQYGVRIVRYEQDLDPDLSLFKPPAATRF